MQVRVRSSRLSLALALPIFAFAACSGGGVGPISPPPSTAAPSTSAAATATPSGATPAPTASPATGPTAAPSAGPAMTPAARATSTPTATPFASPMTTASAAPLSITGLHVVGNQIVNGSGQTIVPHGVDRSGTEYACVQAYGIFDGPSDQASVAAIASWHTDIVRVPLNEDCWLAINGVSAAYAGSNYQTAIVDYVNLLNANGLIAILDLHWSAAGTNSATGQQPMADADHSPAFWQSVAMTFKSNSSVIFDLYNEPYSIPWSCWLEGGTASACGTNFQVAGMNSLISAVRGTGATNIVMAGGLSYSGDLSQWLANEPTDPTGNLAASWHSYNFSACNTQSCFTSTVAPVAAKVPLIAGEIGENDCAHGFIDPLMGWLDAQGSGYLGWAWNSDFDCSNGPGLIGDYSGTPTNFGIGLQTHLATLASSAAGRHTPSR